MIITDWLSCTSSFSSSKEKFFLLKNIVDDNGKVLNLGELRNKFKQRPDHILSKNTKMKHSGGKTVIFYNINMPAFKGLIVDESTGEFKIVDTCPSAGACRVFCYARHGGYIQWKVVSLHQTRLLNYLMNDWNGFRNQLVSEINR